MNTVQILDVLAEAIDKRPLSQAQTYSICYLNHHIHCRPTNCRPTPEIVFGTFTNNQLTQGLTHEQWLILAGKIQNFFLQKGLI